MIRSTKHRNTAPLLPSESAFESFCFYHYNVLTSSPARKSLTAATAVVEMTVFLWKKCFDFKVSRAQKFSLLVLTLTST